MRPYGILETALYTRDLAAARRFFVEVLGLEVHAEQEGRHVFFRCGRGMLLVFNPDTTAREVTTVNGNDIPLHGVAGPTHMAFAIRASEIDAWRARLRSAGVAVESEIVWPNGGHSLYFRDPAGNSLELATPRLWALPEPAPEPAEPAAAGVSVRPERPADHAQVRRIHASAFPTRAEADLVEALRQAGKAVISLVAEEGGEICGHILFSPVTLDGRPGGLGLAPIAVAPDRQRRGIGARLIREGLAACVRAGVPFVVVLGEPGYYSRFGFGRASVRALTNDYEVDEPFMVLELHPGGLPPAGGRVRYADEFGRLSG